MKIGIIGIRGIPNNHGGFEQFAQYLSVSLVDKGIEVYVYNSHQHPYTEDNFHGVKIIKCYDPEHIIGTIGQFIYDLNCIKDARRRQFDILLQLGYTSSSIWGSFLPKKSITITNMDGLEWKRGKYNLGVQMFLKIAERWAVNSSNILISDSIGIKNYLKNKYNVNSFYIAYGAKVFNNPDARILNQFNLQKHNYSLVIARIEPENNIESILKGYRKSDLFNFQPLIVIGDCSLTKYGRYLLKKYETDNNIHFIGAIYNINILNNLRFFSKFYFHGHSVGGTNPSLLEAMASSCIIIAHDNPFNKTVLGKEGYYFNTHKDISEILNSGIEKAHHPFITINKTKIKQEYSWEFICNEYYNLFQKIMKGVV